MGFQENLNSLVQAINNRAKLSDIEPIGDLIANSSSHVPLSGVTSYHLLSGNLALANSVITNGFATTLYTGNGTTQSVVTGVDMATQWGNDASETFGGLVWCKGRSNANGNILTDTIRGVGKSIYTNITSNELATPTNLTAFNSNGFSIGSNGDINTNLATYASWVFQTTHRITGTTNHGKAYTCHYNPFTGFTIVKYEGSGLAGHEIPHHLGRVIDSSIIKRLDVVQDWYVNSLNSSIGLQLNTTSAHTSGALFSSQTITACVLTGTQAAINASGGTYILYGWANSYFDESNTLIGNYEIGIYQGTGAAGNKVTTRGKPAWVMVKRLDGTGNWRIFDNQRPYTLFPSTSGIETELTKPVFNHNGFTVNVIDPENNTAGGQYLYMVVYDNDSGSGKSKYPRATDTSTLNLNATIPFANGIDASGAKNSILSKNETVSGLTFTQGKNYVYSKNDGTYGVTPYRPRYLDTDLIAEMAGDSPDYFDVKSNTWYSTVANPELVTNGTFDVDTTGWTGVNATLSLDNGRLKVTNSAATVGWAYFPITTVVGKKYKVKGSAHYGSTTCSLLVYETTGDPGASTKTIAYAASGVSSSYVEFIAEQTTYYVSARVNAATAGAYIFIDDISGFVSDIELSTPITESRNYLDCVVYADAGGQPTYVEQLPKTEYKEDTIIKSLAITGNFELGQTWKYYTQGVDRFQGAIYTNTTGKPILVTITGFSSTEANAVRILVNGQIVQKSHPNTVSTSACVMALVPNGATYSTYAPNGYSVWAELR